MTELTDLTEIAEAAEIDEVAESIKTFFANSFANGCIKIVVAALILIVGFWIAKIITKLMKKGVLLRRADASVRGFAESATSVVLKVLVVITAAAYMGVPMASVVAVLGSVGLALGLAIQGGLSNVAGGVILILSRPFSIGDYITVSDKSGTVKSIGIYYTTLMAPGNKKIVIPNGVVTSNVVTDFSHEGVRRVDIDFSVSYSSNADTVRKILLNLASSDEKVLKTPEPDVVMTEHSDSSLKFCMHVWVKTGDYWDVMYGMIEKSKKAFDEEGIQIPFPQLDVHINKN